MDTPFSTEMRYGEFDGKTEAKVFSSGFQSKAVRLCKLGDRNITQIAKDLDLTETAL